MENKVTSYFIRQGLIFALVNIVLTMIIYFMGANFIASHFMMVPIVMVIIAIAYPIVVTIQFRKQNDGFLSFQNAFKIAFFMLAISGLITAIFGILLYHVIDPEYPQLIQRAMTEKLTEYMSGLGMSDEKIQESLSKNDMAEKFSVMGQIKSYLFSLIFYAIGSLVIALIAKKNKTPFNSDAA